MENKKIKYNDLNNINILLKAIIKTHKIINEGKTKKKVIKKIIKTIYESNLYENIIAFLFDKNKFITDIYSEGLSEERKKILEESISKGLIPLCLKELLKTKGKVYVVEEGNPLCKDCFLFKTEKKCKTFLIKIEYKDVIYGIIKVYVKKEKILSENKQVEEKTFFMDIANSLAFYFFKKELEVKKEFFKERYEYLFENTPLCVYLSDMEGNFLSVNKECVNMFGYENKEEMYKIDIKNDLYYNPADRESFRETIENNGFVRNFRLRLKKKTGEIVYVENDSVILKNDKGEIIGYQGILKDITERVLFQKRILESEKRLKESEKKFRQIFNSLQDLYYRTDKKRNITMVSPSVKTILGYKPSEIIGKKVMDFYKNKNEFEKIMKLLIKKGEIKDYILEIVNKNGETVIISVNLKPIKNHEGEILGFEGIARDITERVKKEEIEKRYKNLFNSITDCVYFSNTEGKFLDVNNSCLKIFGYDSKEELCSIDMIKDLYIEEENRRAFQKEIEAKGFSNNFRLYLKKKDGTPIILEDTSVAIKNDKGEIIGYQGVMRDVTKKIKNEEKLLLLASLVEQMNSAIVITDWDGNIEFVNPAFTKITGYKSEEVIGKNPKILQSGKHKKPFYQNLWITIKSGRVWKDIFINKRKDGTIYYEGATIFPIKDKHGKIRKFGAIKSDITKRIEQEKELVYKNKELMEANRKLKETHAQLVQQEKLASIGILAAGIAHELNNPIGFISSNLNTLKKYNKTMFELMKLLEKELLENGKNNCERIVKSFLKYKKEKHIDFMLEDVRDLVEESLEGIERITSIVQNLRSFSRVDQIGDVKEYDIREGIKSTLVIAKNSYKYVAEVKTEFEEVPLIRCMPNEVNQVFLNIIVNAAQAIESEKRGEKGLILIKVYEEDEYVCCSIYDDGPKIPENIIVKIFDPFFTTKEVGKGTGLGLNICYDIIVNKHKGKLLVKNGQDKGVEFIIKLPKKFKGGVNGEEV